ncbi:predicted protein [Nematostella vectensis]|uniref:Reverse transcriptase domain-containing protein n=1 Tax=Nematostella vectensis TaxID=45351 RepID=A7S0P9_NEMVE|nr:predicted protein [Nematostella vectensis]|eukprot:XP_001634772.1 predicted protein [Nematostella vectensis]
MNETISMEVPGSLSDYIPVYSPKTIVWGLQKPSKTSKSKDHQECLGKRLALWKNGNIEELIREGRTIQRRLVQFHRKKDAPQNTAKLFAKLVMEEQINSALRYLTESDYGGVLSLTDDVMRQLQEKHPNAQPAKLGSLLFGPAEDVHESIYSEITGGMIREAALRTKGAGGPSNVDAHGFQRILASKSFKKSSSDLCDALALLTRRLCTDEVRPIGVGEVLRRIIGKCVTKVLKQDIVESSGSLQVCAGQKSGSEAAVHAVYNLFQHEQTDAVMLVDASNAFNSVNRAAALHNIRVLCPTLAPFFIYPYRLPARLFVAGGKELVSAEGTTQGDPLAMSMYALSLQPLISQLQAATQVNQCWFADDATGCGSLDDVRQWWDTLQSSGPDLGYFPNAVKCWLVTKPEKEESARKIFEGTGINITTEGRKHLGAALGSRPHLEQYVDSKVDEWVGQVCGPLAEQIKQQTHELPCDDAVQEAQQEARREKNEYLKSRYAEVKSSLPVNMLRAVDLATQEGASSWLTVLPLRLMSFDLNKREFRDALGLRYDWEIPETPSICVCGDTFDADHAMICKRGGFVIQRHNELRDLEAELLSLVCKDVQTEPVLQDITGEELNRGAHTARDARLDIVARGFWERQRQAFFDVRVCHANAESYRDMNIDQIFRQHETEKKRQYARVLEVEQATFTPLVFGSTGGMASECQQFHSKLAELIAEKKGELYSTTVSWIRAKVSFAILRSALLCLRGSRSPRRAHVNIYDNDFEIKKQRPNIF